MAIIFPWITSVSQTTHICPDWGNLNRYKQENQNLAVKKSKRVVLMGNSITESWLAMRADFFRNNPYLVNRGISGQTTGQMLVRFRQDVVNLQPDVVVIMAGINDIAENQGPATLEEIRDNIHSMAVLAANANIKVVLCSVLPAAKFPWRPGLQPAPKVYALNQMLKELAQKYNYAYLDYYAAMVNDSLGMKSGLSYDDVHPSEAGYQIMEPLLLKKLEEFLK
jgi:lysophospholipase L1-like esterase